MPKTYKCTKCETRLERYASPKNVPSVGMGIGLDIAVTALALAACVTFVEYWAAILVVLMVYVGFKALFFGGVFSIRERLICPNCNTKFEKAGRSIEVSSV